MVEAFCEVDAAIGTQRSAALHALHKLVRTLLEDAEKGVESVMVKSACLQEASKVRTYPSLVNIADQIFLRSL